jgi:hypothetical protein
MEEFAIVSELTQVRNQTHEIDQSLRSLRLLRWCVVKFLSALDITNGLLALQGLGLVLSVEHDDLNPPIRGEV